MRREFRTLALFTCITAASAVGAQFAAADTGKGHDGSKSKCEEQHRRHGHRGEHFFKRLAKELGLNDQQKSQAKAILEASRAQNMPYFKAMMTEKRQMKELILTGTADEAAIRAQSAKVAAAEADLAVQRGKEAKQLLALLTPEQKTKLKTIMDKREQKFRHGMHGDDAPEQ
jgi:periplasmic protein CpxP/Spy